MDTVPESREPEPCANCELGNWPTCRCKYGVYRRELEKGQPRDVVSPSAIAQKPRRSADGIVPPEEALNHIAKIRKMLQGDQAS